MLCLEDIASLVSSTTSGYGNLSNSFQQKFLSLEEKVLIKVSHLELSAPMSHILIIIQLWIFKLITTTTIRKLYNKTLRHWKKKVKKIERLPMSLIANTAKMSILQILTIESTYVMHCPSIFQGNSSQEMKRQLLLNIETNTKNKIKSANQDS